MTTNKVTIDGQECLRLTGLLTDVQKAVAEFFYIGWEIVPKSSHYSCNGRTQNTTALRPSKYSWAERTKKD